MKIKCFLAISVFLSTMAVVHTEAQQGDSKCVFSTASNGQIITVRGKVRSEPHDLAFDVFGCNDTVLLTYAGKQDNDVGATSLQNDNNMKLFKKYTDSTYKSRGRNICMQCSKYGDVEAELTAKLEIAILPLGATKDKANFIRDPSGKIIGLFGWGHPGPFAGYRLIIQSVSQVKAHRIPRP